MQRRHDNTRRGPTLPAALLTALGDGAAGPSPSRRPRGGGGAGRGLSRKALRREQRHGKKASREAHQVARASAGRASYSAQQQPGAPPARGAGRGARPQPQQHQQQRGSSAAPSRGAHVGSNSQQRSIQHAPAAAPDRKRPAAPPSRSSAPDAKRTRFEELLPGGAASHGAVDGVLGVNTSAAYLADLRTARDLERRLGIKRGGTLKGPEDGLPGLLKGLSSATPQLLPSYLTGPAAEQARTLLGAGGAEGEEEDEEGEEEGEDEDEDDMMLGDSDEGEEGMDGSSDEQDALDEDEDEDEDEDGLLGEGDEGEEESDGDAGFAGLMGSDSEGSEGDLDGALVGEEGEDEDEDEDGEMEEQSAEGEDEEEGEEGEEEGSEGDAAAAAAPAKAEPSAGRYVPPALRAQQQGAGGGAAGTVERRVTGLLNRLADSNLPSIVKDLADLYGDSRRAVTTAVVQQLIQAAVHGPRATPAFATAAAALVAGLAGTVGAAEMSAGFLEGAAQQLEAAVQADDSLSSHNLMHLLASCQAVGLVSPDLMYGLLRHLLQRFTEHDVQLIVTLLTSRGLALRGADPAAMKEFVLAVSTKVSAMHAASTTTPTPTTKGGAAGKGAGKSAAGSTANAGANGSGAGLSARARLMLELVIDVKNNRATRAAGGGGGGKGKQQGGTSISVSPATAAWLRGCQVDRVAVRGITWDKLLLPGKKGMWWLPAAGEALIGRGGGGAGAAGGGAGAGGGSMAQRLLALAGGEGLEGGGEAEAAQLLALASAQRMNTDVRRAVFVAVMGAADVVHAHERLLRLPLKGEQQREVVRVVVDCCLHEETYNPFYALLIARLATHSKAHRLTAQFCMWDQYKVLAELSPMALTHLARLHATLVVKDVLPLTCLKVFEISGAIEAKPLFFLRLLLQHVLAACRDTQQVSEVFGRVSQVAGTSKLTTADAPATSTSQLQSGLMVFIRTKLGPWLADQDPDTRVGKVTMDELLLRLRAAEAVLAKSGRQ